MLKKIYTLLLLFFIFSCFQFCSLAQIKDESPKVNIVKKESKFKINLPEEHSSGYIWQLSENYDKAIVKDLGAVWHGQTKGIDFNLQAMAVGQTTLSFVLRKFDDTLNNKKFIVNIVNK